MPTTYPTDSLGLHLRESIASALSGVTTEDSVRWSSQPSAGPYVPNPGFWLPQPTCVLTRTATGKFNGCLITPKHVVLAKHTSTGWPSTAFRFCKADGTVCDRVSTARTVISGTDIAIATLNADVDAGITPAKLLPADVDDVLVGLYRDPIPGVVFNRSDNGLLMSVRSPLVLPHGGSPNPSMSTTKTGGSLGSPYSTMTYTPIVGDSGSPWLLLINGEWVLIGCMDSSATVPAIHAYISEINAITGEGYEVETVDLSGFSVPSAATPETEPEYPQDTELPLYQEYGGGMASITVSAANNASDGTTSGGGLTFDEGALSGAGNAYASDNAYATRGGATGGGAGDAEGFIWNFGVASGALDSIPSDATIDGFLVEFEDKITGTGYSFNQTAISDRVSLTQSSSEYGESYNSGHVGTAQTSSALPGSSDAYRSWGGSTNKFGRTWTPAQVKSSDFKVKYAAAWEYLGSGTACTYYLDHVRVTVYYTAAAGGDTPTPITLTASGGRRGRSAVQRRRLK